MDGNPYRSPTVAEEAPSLLHRRSTPLVRTLTIAIRAAFALNVVSISCGTALYWIHSWHYLRIASDLAGAMLVGSFFLSLLVTVAALLWFGKLRIFDRVLAFAPHIFWWVACMGLMQLISWS